MNGVQSRPAAVWKIIVLCLICVVCNQALRFLFGLLKIPLFGDTYFTVAICFTAGLLPGILTGVLLVPPAAFIKDYLITEQPVEIRFYFFVICALAEILLVCFFYAKIKDREDDFLRKPSLVSFTGVAVHLLVLVALDCIVVSICGGLIDFILSKFSVPLSYSFEDTFELGLLRNNVHALAAAILSRIPINIIDRFFAIFGGYGVSIVFRKRLKAASTSPETPA